MFYGTITAYNVINPATGNHFAGSLSIIPGIGQMGYIALTAFGINALIAAIATVILAAAGVQRGHDETVHEDYVADEGDLRVGKRLETPVLP
jgi:SSS family solute:Na+ symporter